MRHLKLFESFNKLPFSKLDIEEVENHLMEWTDKNAVEVNNFEQYLNPVGWIVTPNRIFKDYGTIFNLYSDKFNNQEISRYDLSSLKSITFIAEIPHPGGMRGTNLDLHGYTRDILNHYLKKIHDNYDVDIYIQIQDTNYYNDIVSKSRIVIVPKTTKVEEKSQETIEYIESFFTELSDYKDDTYPIIVNVRARVIGKNKYDGYQVNVTFDTYDKYFMEKKIDLIKNRLKPEFNIHSSSVDKTSMFRTKHIPVHGTDRTSMVQDPIYCWSISLSPKFNEIIESVQESSTLIIVDVQKSFKKWFNDKYVNELTKYAGQFTDVYQIWDNHYQGKNVDKDYLYDENPEIPVDGDLYTFPNQREIIEKRYNYDVDVDFYKKILSDEVYKAAKQKEQNKQLKRGDLFETEEGTYIVYIGNNHKWYHLPKKLYELFSKLKGKEVIMVGGSDMECFLDVETAANSLGVKVKRNFKYIYSASHCPIK